MSTLSTKNYSQFVSNPLQRKFSASHVKALVESIRENGFLKSQAISVFRNKSGKLVINTGHHRLAACKQLGIPVYYIIEHQWTEVMLLNEGQLVNKWGISEAAIMYARLGRKDYEDLLGYVDKGIPLGMAGALLIGNVACSGNAQPSIRDGSFRIKTREYINNIIHLFEEFPRNQVLKHRSFIQAYSKCIFCEEFDSVVFLKRLRANPSMIEKTSSEHQSLDMIAKLYNHGARKTIPLAYIVTEKSKARGNTFGRDKGDAA